MKTIIVAIIFFVIGFFVGGGIGINLGINWGFDSMISGLKRNINYSLSITKDSLSGSYLKVQNILNQKKQQYIKVLDTKKEEMIKNIENDIKNKLKEEIDNLF